ncbi:hypothetical protein NHX12_015004 [Muraenolepis orangiensis]|uniref:RRM domain-containing protein n=1 Tax=Muraenolepis orangiensis TaxID=630683 RepID=A0A9Q0D938_9TELE|nr:hypothetical protein NHX12_015004 [Muraenolepis orangiensis]
MANRNIKHENMQSQSNSPPAAAGGPTPSPPTPGDGGGDGDGTRGTGGTVTTLEMVLDLKSFRKPGEKTFTQHCRLFVGNLPTDLSEDDFKRLFAKYSEANEVFINRDRGFGS